MYGASVKEHKVSGVVQCVPQKSMLKKLGYSVKKILDQKLTFLVQLKA